MVENLVYTKYIFSCVTQLILFIVDKKCGCKTQNTKKKNWNALLFKTHNNI